MNRHRTQRLLLTIASCLFGCAIVVAQKGQPGSSADTPPTDAQSQAPHGINPVQSSESFVQLLQRKSLVFPDLATQSGPLDSWQKFKLAANNSISFSTISVASLAAAYGQAINSPSGYGQGGEGYGKRFGADLARAASDNIFGTFLVASLLHEDPRFYVKHNLSFKQSVKYSAVRVLMTRNDRGERAVNFAGLLGPMAGEALANTYYPEGDRSIGNTFIRYSSDLGWRFGGNLLRQYWPKINKKLRLAPPIAESAR